MSRSLLGGAAELERVVDEPLHLLRGEAALEAGHRAVALGDALADGRAVAAQRHGRDEQVGVGIEGQRARVPLSPVAVATGAVGLVELGRGEVLPGAAGKDGGGDRDHGHGERREETERTELQGLRWTWVAVAWSRGRTTISSM